MSESLKLSILTLDRKFFTGEIKHLITETELGGIEIMPNHTPTIASLIPTVTSFITIDDKEYKAFTSTGVIKVDSDGVELLCDTAEWPDEIDVDRAEEAKKSTEELIRRNEGVNSRRTDLKLRRSIMRIKAKEK